MREIWAEESGFRIRFERESGGIEISIIDIDKGTLASATVTPWRWRQIIDAFPVPQKPD